MKSLTVVGLAAVLWGLAAGGAWAQSAAPVRDAASEAPLIVPRAFQNSLGMALVPIPAGEFLMGSTDPMDPNFSWASPSYITLPVFASQTKARWPYARVRCPMTIPESLMSTAMHGSFASRPTSRMPPAASQRKARYWAQ